MRALTALATSDPREPSGTTALGQGKVASRRIEMIQAADSAEYDIGWAATQRPL